MFCSRSVKNKINKINLSIYPFQGWGSLTMALTGKFAYMPHHFILLLLNSFGRWIDRKGWWFDTAVSIFLSSSSVPKITYTCYGIQ